MKVFGKKLATFEISSYLCNVQKNNICVLFLAIDSGLLRGMRGFFRLNPLPK